MDSKEHPDLISFEEAGVKRSIETVSQLKQYFNQLSTAECPSSRSPANTSKLKPSRLDFGCYPPNRSDNSETPLTTKRHANVRGTKSPAADTTDACNKPSKHTAFHRTSSSTDANEIKPQSPRKAVHRPATSVVHITRTLLPGVQGCAELAHLVETVEGLVAGKAPSADEARLSPLSSSGEVKNIDYNDGWVYDMVYGPLTGHSRKQRSSPDTHYWESKTATHMVAHLTPSLAKTDVAGPDTPMHLVNKPKWQIPEMEVFVTVYLTNDHWRLDTGNEVRVSSSGSISPNGRKVRLVCDPNSLLVSELMLKSAGQAVLNTQDYQLRILGRAVLLHQNAYLSQCRHVQVCCRFDLPLEFVLEPRRAGQAVLDRRDSIDRKPFAPLSMINADRQHSIENDIVYCSNILEVVIKDIEDTIIYYNGEVQVKQWISKTNNLTSNLVQSLKALVTVACIGVVFSTLLDHLDEVIQVLRWMVNKVFKSAVQPQTSGDAFTTIPLYLNKSPDSGAPEKPVSVSEFLASTIGMQARRKLKLALHHLQTQLVIQLESFVDWQQLGMKVIPDIPAGGGVNPRPVGLVVDREELGINIHEDVDCPVISTKQCMDPFLVEVVSVFNMPQSSSPYTRMRPSLNSGSLAQAENMQSRFNSQFRIRIGLMYAGIQLSSVFPADLDGQYASTTDTHMSDPGRYRPQRHSFPEMLDFTQQFRFPSFPINRLPREVLLTVALFSSRNGASENIKTDGVLLGWVNIPLFTPTGRLRQGDIVTGLWPPLPSMSPFRPVWTQTNKAADHPIVHIRLQKYEYSLVFPKIHPDIVTHQKGDQVRLRKRSRGLSGNAQNAAQFAARSMLMHSFNPAMSKADAVKSFTQYRSAASASHLMGSSGKLIIPSLKLFPTESSVPSTSSCFRDVPTTTQTMNVQTNNDLERNDSVPTVAVLSPQNSTSSGSSRTLPISQELTTQPSISVEVLWNLRWYLTVDNPNALAALLLGVLTCWPYETRCNNRRNPVWNWDKLLSEIYGLLSLSPAPSPALAIRLLAGDVPDHGIRHWAVRGLALLPPDILLLYLPQILEVTCLYIQSTVPGIENRSVFAVPLCPFPIRQLNSAMNAPTVGQPSGVSLVTWRIRRFAILKSALEWVVTDRLRMTWKCQQVVSESLSETALEVKKCRTDSNARLNILMAGLHRFPNWLNVEGQSPDGDSTQRLIPKSLPASPQPLLIDFDDDTNKSIKRNLLVTEQGAVATPSIFDTGFRMPYNPGLLTHQIQITACSYFNSFTSPLRLSFKSLDNIREPITVIFKAGDDLRLDSTVSQMTLLMDRIWLNAGVDLRMVHFNVLPLKDRQGYIELVPNSTSLRVIQLRGGGLTGAFKERVITTWLQEQCTTELEYQKALDNFLRSLAGFSVATYVLGVGDRHNDNILIQSSGHLFHVDFAKVFGQVQTFAGIKRDRVPFVLTPEMLHVLHAYSAETDKNNTTGGAKAVDSREGMQTFIELCCQAYNLLRQNAQDILAMLELCLSMNIPDITMESIQHVLRSLQLEYNDQQATQHFTQLIHKTAQSKASTLNFFVHGLAQSKQQSSHINPTSVAKKNCVSSPVLSPQDCQGPTSPVAGVPNNLDRDQLFSFIPRRYTLEKNNKIESVVVKTVRKMKVYEKISMVVPVHDYFFPMDVLRQNGRVNVCIYRRMADVFELCMALMDSFKLYPIAQPIMSAMCELSIFSISSAFTQERLQQLLNFLLDRDHRMSESDLIYTFFHSDDASENAPSPGLSQDHNKQNTLASGANSSMTSTQLPKTFTPPKRREIELNRILSHDQQKPALQVELCLNASLSRLDVLIKHGRGLVIPGTLDLPDVYVKVYLITRRRRPEHKQKTSVVRQTSQPSFNASFTYMINPSIVKFAHLEISACHFERLGENVLLGNLCLPLRTLKPGQCLTDWHELTNAFPVA